MYYDFDTLVDRTTSDSIKWRLYGADVLPMWVADMDFRSPQPIIDALTERVAHGLFGYAEDPAPLRAAIQARLDRMYGWHVAHEAIVFLPGVVTGFNLVLHALNAPGDGLLIQTPVYPPILEAHRNHGMVRRANELALQPDGSYKSDMAAFERTIDERTRTFLLCNPHNPVGRVFAKEELTQMAEICLRHDLLICSDEIHCDLVYSGHQHVPIASLDPEIGQRTVTLMAPSKTFNIAGLDCSFAIIEDPELRRRVEAGRSGMVGGVNVLGLTAARAAYEHGQPWLDALLRYLEGNRDLLAAFVRERLPGIRMAAPQGTYLAWLDCRDAGLPGNAYKFFLDEAKVAGGDGIGFGEDGAGFLRFNFGCPRPMLIEALERMAQAMQRMATPAAAR